MTAPIFIDKDAEWLYTLGQTFIEDGDFNTGLRLTKTAERLQRIDTALQNLQKDGAYAAGVKDAYNRIYARSNLPEPERTPMQEMREAIARTTVQPRRVEKEKPVKLNGLKQHHLDALASITINLTRKS